MTELVIIVLCLMLNALLSATETAFVSVGRPELRAMSAAGVAGAARLLTLRERPERTLAVIQIGITTVGLISGAVGGAGSRDTLRPFFEQQLGLGPAFADLCSIAIVVAPLTYLTVVVGELAPKALALRNPQRIGLRGAIWLTTFDRMFSPAVTALEWSANVVLRGLGAARSAAMSSSEREADQLSDAKHRYIVNLANIEAKTVGDIALLWPGVTSVEATQTAEQVMSVVMASGHTRLPVCGPDGQVMGLLHTKEFLAFTAAGEPQWQSLIRPALSTKASDSLLKVLRVMQEKRSHLVVVYRDDGSRLGVVTLEDIIEEVFGDVYDEDDDQTLRRLLSARARRRGLGGATHAER